MSPMLVSFHQKEGASIAIGVLLIVVAFRLGMDSRELLIGRSAEPKVRQVITEEIEQTPGVDRLLELQTMHMGPDSLIVATRVALNDDMGADQTEDLADEIDRRLAQGPANQPALVEGTVRGLGEHERAAVGRYGDLGGVGVAPMFMIDSRSLVVRVRRGWMTVRSVASPSESGRPRSSSSKSIFAVPAMVSASARVSATISSAELPASRRASRSRRTSG